MKSILISIKPKWVAKILNGEKTIEIRKNKALAKATQKLINEYRYAEIYVYCSKDEYLYRTNKGYIASKKPLAVGKGTEYTFAYSDESKVLFKFRCYKVEEIPTRRFSVYTYPYTKTLDDYELLDKSCLSTGELENYFGDNVGYAIHISDLEIFDRPKELSEFYPYCKDKKCEYRKNHCSICYRIPLTKAPQNFCYVEVDYD